MTENGSALQIINVGYYGTVTAGALYNAFRHFIRVFRTIHNVFIERRHCPRNVIRKCSRTGNLVKNAVFAEYFSDGPQNKGAKYLPFTIKFHCGLHAVHGAHRAFSRYKTAQQTSLPSRTKLFRTGDAALRNRYYRFRHTYNIFRPDIFAGIMHNCFYNIISMGQYTSMNRY